MHLTTDLTPIRHDTYVAMDMGTTALQGSPSFHFGRHSALSEQEIYSSFNAKATEAAGMYISAYLLLFRHFAIIHTAHK